ncbi:MAG: nucleoside triphosphate pyrophosphatase [Granulosicoccus sp.]
MVLASRSERREQLLRQIGLSPASLPVDIDETPLPDECPVELVKRLARAKAIQCRNVLATPGFSTEAFDLRQDVGIAASDDRVNDGASHRRFDLVLAADTVIDLDGQVVGKPVSRKHCLQTLSALAGRSHKVHSGVCVLHALSDQVFTDVVTTEVTFGPINARQALDYWETGEPWGKAGSYAIQGLGAVFVVRLNGSYSGVVGLPLYQTVVLLKKAGLPFSLPDNPVANTDSEQ